MKTLLIASAAALVLLAGGARAQSSSDEAAARAAGATAARERAELRHGPWPEAVAPGDYRAAAHEATRQAQWRAERAAIRAYAAGQPPAPIAVDSEDTARAEAARETAAHELSIEARIVGAEQRSG